MYVAWNGFGLWGSDQASERHAVPPLVKRGLLLLVSQLKLACALSKPCPLVGRGCRKSRSVLMCVLVRSSSPTCGVLPHVSVAAHFRMDL